MNLRFKFGFAAVVAAISALLSPRARGIVVNFDDLPDDENYSLTGSGYAGLTWEAGNAGLNGNIGSWVTPSSTTSQNYPYSAPHDAINAWGCTQLGIGFPTAVDLAGAYISAQGDPNSWTTGLRVRGYLAGQLIDTTPQFASIGSTPTWFEMDLHNVDRVVFESVPIHFGAGWFGMDDLTYTPLPEPSAIFLLSLGALSLLPRRRERR